jgi:hypothetical protein
MNTIKLSEDVIKLVIAIRGKMQQDTEYREVTRDTRIKLILTLQDILKNKENRKDVLRALTGIKMPEWSQSRLTQHTHCVIIDAIVERKHDKEIREIERLIETYRESAIGLFAIGVFPNGELPTMPDMFQDDLELPPF